MIIILQKIIIKPTAKCIKHTVTSDLHCTCIMLSNGCCAKMQSLILVAPTSLNPHHNDGT